MTYSLATNLSKMKGRHDLRSGYSVNFMYLDHWQPETGNPRGRFDFDEVFADEDRLTQAVTLFALLEMHKRGEATWSQRDLFGPIEVEVMHD